MLIGHQKQWNYLKKLVSLERIPHGLIFSGENHLGKRKIAKDFAKLLNCEGDRPPCANCFFCRQIEKEIFPDLLIIMPSVEQGEIQISQIRELSWKLSLKPYSSKYKIAIIDRAESLNQEAANCLLKTLEEPTHSSILILITSSPESLPKTILSRTQIIKFFPVPVKELKDGLEKEGFEKDVLAKYNLIIEKEPIGKVLDFLRNPEKITKNQEKLGEFIKISQSSLSSRFKYAEKMAKNESLDLKEVLLLWLGYLRTTLLSQLELSQGNSVAKLKKNIENIERIYYLITRTNINTRLALEIAMMEL